MKWIPLALIESFVIILLTTIIIWAGSGIIDKTCSMLMAAPLPKTVYFQLPLSSYEELRELAQKIDGHFSFLAVKYDRKLKTFTVIFRMTEEQAKEFLGKK